jgi:hypothetical protein
MGRATREYKAFHRRITFFQLHFPSTLSGDLARGMFVCTRINAANSIELYSLPLAFNHRRLRKICRRRDHELPPTGRQWVNRHEASRRGVNRRIGDSPTGDRPTGALTPRQLPKWPLPLWHLGHEGLSSHHTLGAGWTV